MKIWVVISGVASTLFVASILTFGLPTEIASAHGSHPHSEDCTGPHKKDDGCGGGGGGVKTGITYTVTMEASDTGDLAWVVTGVGCEGFTESGKLHVTFPGGDGPCTNEHVFIGDDPYWVVGLDVRPNRTDVQLFMSSEELVPLPQVQPGETMYNLGRLTWTREDLDDGAFKLNVGLTGQNIVKIHDRNNTEGPIAIGNIVYTPID